ncbi:hypothetical protein LY78DRAFT_158916 [Colletotrichum sublineola]|nr:hypothetical protein LY78DRAFT_158916 [Colletotrichum sublineola]
MQRLTHPWALPSTAETFPQCIDACPSLNIAPNPVCEPSLNRRPCGHRTCADGRLRSPATLYRARHASSLRPSRDQCWSCRKGKTRGGNQSSEGELSAAFNRPGPRPSNHMFIE